MGNKKTSGFKSLINHFLHVKRRTIFRDEFREIRETIKIESSCQTKDELLSLNPDLERDIKEICKKHGLHENPFKDILLDRLVSGSWDNETISERYNSDMCELIVPVLNDDEELINRYKDNINEFPISIKISAYASGRNIKDFIDKNSRLIAEVQKLYKKNDVSLGKVKKRRNQEVSDYIYHNQNKELRVIARELARKGHHRDVGNIGKILSEEKERRD